MGDNLVESWKRQIQWHSDNNYFNELNWIDGQPMCSSGIFPRIHYSGNPHGKITVWTRELHKQDHYETYYCKPDGSWDRTADKMLLSCAGSDHLVFRGTIALERERRELRSKESGMKSTHFNGSNQNIELLLQTVISVNQLSIYGAVADMIEELPVGQRPVEKPIAPSQQDKVEIITQPPLAETQANEERQGKLLQEYEQRFAKMSEDQKLSNRCSEAGLRQVEIGQFFHALPSPREIGYQSLCRECTKPRDQKKNSYRRMDP